MSDTRGTIRVLHVDDEPDFAEMAATFLEREREEHPELPFVLFTGKGSEEVASEAIRASIRKTLDVLDEVDQRQGRLDEE